MVMNERLKASLLKAQKNEITEHFIYKKLAEITKNERNRKVLNKIAEDEDVHYQYLKKLTPQEVKPDNWLSLPELLQV